MHSVGPHMGCSTSPNVVLDEHAIVFYRRALATLNAARVRHLVGGAYAVELYAGVGRSTKDLDIFVRPEDVEAALAALAAAGYQTELTFSHWLGKAFCCEDLIDIIFSSGNGVARVDDLWFEHAVEADVLGLAVRLCPVEETIWSKAFVLERERCDAADIAHLIRSRGAELDWARLVRRFGPHWRVLLSHLVLFGFVYPGERAKVPASVMQRLVDRLTAKPADSLESDARVCYGTLLSRAQYLTDVQCWEYEDARLQPRGTMTPEETARWTEAIDTE